MTHSSDTELFELCKKVYELTGWDNKANTPSSERLKVWQRGYSISEMGEGHDDYATTPPEERNKVDVYDWEIREDPRHKITTGQEVFKWWYSQVKTIENNVIPLYTSDYLLEKLPASVQDYYLTLGKGDEYCAEYADSGTSSLYRRNADTPLKSLLKLTVALHKAGEIR